MFLLGHNCAGVARSREHVPPKLLLWGAAGIIVAVIAAIAIARKQLPSSAAIRSLLDQQNHCGGLLMAEVEHPLGDWQARLGEIHLPRLHWRGARAWGLLAASIAFVSVSLLVPVRFAAMNAGRALDVRTKKSKT